MSEEPRIGVFVCHCGSNIAGHVDVAAVAEYAQSLPGVACVQRNLYTCSDAGLTEIKAASIDVAAMTAVEHGVEVQFMNNIPLPIAGDLSQIETKVLALCQRLRDRWENTP